MSDLNKASGNRRTPMMIFQMLRVRAQQRKVLYAIIQSVTVYVMHYLTPFQFPSKVLLHHKPMFQWSFPFRKHHSVAGIVDRSRSERRVFSDTWITVALPFLVVIVAKPTRNMLFPTIFNGANS